MTWTRLDDGHFERLVVLDLSRDAQLVEVEAFVYGNRTGTDGAIDRRALRRVTGSDDPEAAAAELVAAGLWIVTNTGWQVVGWSELQPTAADVLRRRTQEQQRSARWRAHQRGDHTLCTQGLCKSLPPLPSDSGVTRDGTRDDTRTERVSNDAPSRPVPTRREGRGETAAPSPAGAGHGSPSRRRTCEFCSSTGSLAPGARSFGVCDRCELRINDPVLAGAQEPDHQVDTADHEDDVEDGRPW